MQHTGRFELTDTFRPQSKQVAENFLVVLAENRRLEFQVARELRKP